MPLPSTSLGLTGRPGACIIMSGSLSVRSTLSMRLNFCNCREERAARSSGDWVFVSSFECILLVLIVSAASGASLLFHSVGQFRDFGHRDEMTEQNLSKKKKNLSQSLFAWFTLDDLITYFKLEQLQLSSTYVNYLWPHIFAALLIVRSDDILRWLSLLAAYRAIWGKKAIKVAMWQILFAGKV